MQFPGLFTPIAAVLEDFVDGGRAQIARWSLRWLVNWAARNFINTNVRGRRLRRAFPGNNLNYLGIGMWFSMALCGYRLAMSTYLTATIFQPIGEIEIVRNTWKIPNIDRLRETRISKLSSDDGHDYRIRQLQTNLLINCHRIKYWHFIMIHYQFEI